MVSWPIVVAMPSRLVIEPYSDDARL